MKRKLGIVFMILGLLLLLAALFLYLSNKKEEAKAEETAHYYVAAILKHLQATTAPTAPGSGTEAGEQLPVADNEIVYPDPYDPTMTEVTIDGYRFVGYLQFPSLALELPVMSDTGEDLLQISPCRFSGSTKTDNLVIGAHNYWSHFGQITDLGVGDEVYFIDMDGKTWTYGVAAMETLQPDAVDALTQSDYALTLYTCTYGGRSRIIIRCDLITS